MRKVFVPALILACVALSADARAEDVPADAGAEDLPADTAVEDLPGGQCLACHLETEDGVGELWQDDVHARAGISCETCHGGDPAQDDSELAKRSGSGYRGAFSAKEIALACGGCHSDVEYMKVRKPLLPVDQLDKYRTSEHGKLLAKAASTESSWPRARLEWLSARAATALMECGKSTTRNRRFMPPTFQRCAGTATRTLST
jgi:hypothetical protein